ncbi:tetratricopeptide repeat protein [Erythrobacter dokdonensis]|uniref:Cytochrome c-type biogenesis protein cycH n=1 Tax=Erythrobacter dokdonensis DSW-74 TaxID=1300349 RepID=A0A1A7BBX9_9SPHN|nr:tetratricopeptide repeat protein [Erythrobacter dokdonensis]OBV10028.1 Cytochrome c-type biogenesis protein cycH [Erythrobacter dokdonensis DSW-74]
MDTKEKAPAEGASKAGWILLGAALVLAAGSIGYNVYGGAGGGDAPASVDGAAPSIEDLRKAAEAASDDAGPWADLAFAHFRQGQFAEAATAYARAAEIAPEDAVLHSALGEALVMASSRDPLPPQALAAFEKALALDPSDPRARYFMGVKKDIDKDHEGAIAAWLDLLADTPPGAPWEADLVRTIEQVGKINGIDVAPRIAKVQEGRQPPLLAPGPGSLAADAGAPDVRGPSAAEVAAAGAMTPSQQREMAEGMVAQLEGRLQENPGNLDGWVMLMRSRMTLGEPAKAKAALEAAIKANPAEAAELRRQAQALGIG